jgi:integrase
MTMGETPSQPDRLPISLKPAQWPEADRRAWATSQTTSRSPFRKDHGGPTRSPHTTRKVEVGYGRFISFLVKHDPERLGQHPRDRLSPDVLDNYFAALTGSGYADHTVVCAFDEVRAAMTWMYPGVDFSFITRPNGSPLSWRLPMKSRQRDVPHQTVWLACARGLFASGLADPDPNSRCRKIRDAVLLGVLVTAAPRIETLWRLELHRHVRRSGDGWVLEFTKDILKTGRKTGRGLEVPVEPEVATWLDRYVTTERHEWLAGKMHDALWVVRGGTPMKKGSLGMRVRVLSAKYLGEEFGPHACRVALATSAAIDGSDHPLDASLLLNHTSSAMTLRHYNRANAMAAGKRHAIRIKKMRAELRKSCGPKNRFS